MYGPVLCRPDDRCNAMNVDFTTLDITGHGGEPVPNQFLRQERETSTLAVLLPGQGYTARMPLFYYAVQTALERGWDVLSVDYAYPPLAYDDDSGARAKRLEARKREVEADVDAAFAVGLAQRAYGRVVLVGKSLGTRAMTHLLSRGIAQETWNIWLTPLINELELRQAIEAHPDRTFLAIGTEDFAWDRAYLETLSAGGHVETVIIERADHSMDIAGDIAGSIQAVGEVMARLDAFLPPA
jgi:hypothetical protein